MAYIQRTQTGGNRKTFTLSFWVKRANVTDEQTFFSISNGASYMQLKFNASEYLEYNDGPSTIRFITSRKFIDPAAWYHIVIKYDSTQSTQADRFKMFINGTQETAFGTSTYPGLNTDSQVNINSGVLRIGVDQSTTGTYYGEMSHVQLVDGTALDATSFGEVDSTSGIWKIKTSCYGTPGTNGFCLKMEDRTNLDLDSSSNALTFTTSGTLTPTYDNPSNNFATLNPLTATSAGQDLENGNLYCPGPNSPNYWQSVPATLGARAGKWYWEFKDENSWGSTSDSTRRYGICDLDTIVHTLSSGADARFSGSTSGYAYMNASGVRYNGGTISGTAANYPTFTDGDIIQVAMDLDNQKLYFGKNGTWLDSSDPTSGATGTGSVADISATATWSPYVEIKYGSDNVSANFGNGYFRTTAVASTNADDAGIGSFEYDVPTGYYALCTKNIKVYG